jgi:xanthine dehydrogenase iron-sulfur cluster and FAD-binding subunit A
MQCGACTSGMVISAVALLERTPHPQEDEIRAALVPHLCRCGVYGRVIRAVQRAARWSCRARHPPGQTASPWNGSNKGLLSHAMGE